MEKRPTSLTIIAWIMIISALFSLYSATTMTKNPVSAQILARSPLPASAHVAFAVFGSVATLIAGYGVLKGYPWSRWLYLGLGVLSLIFSVVTVPIISVIVLSVVFLIVIAFFLFRPAANRWFNQPTAD